MSALGTKRTSLLHALFLPSVNPVFQREVRYRPRHHDRFFVFVSLGRRPASGALLRLRTRAAPSVAGAARRVSDRPYPENPLLSEGRTVVYAPPSASVNHDGRPR